jgi:DNA-binding MarR family transcriptional regulator
VAEIEIDREAVEALTEGRTQPELADRLGLTRANVSQVLDRLEAAGPVRRVPDARAYALPLADGSRQRLTKGATP